MADTHSDVELGWDMEFHFVTKTRFVLYAEDGTYAEVPASVFALTKEGDEFGAEEFLWKN